MTISRRGFSVNVFLPTGDPEGVKVVEKSNWSGRGSLKGVTFVEVIAEKNSERRT